MVASIPAPRDTRASAARRGRRILAAATSLALALAGLGAAGMGDAEAEPGVASNVPPGYALSWADEFDGADTASGLDESEWFYREGEKAICSNQRKNVTVSGGLLRIALKKEQVNDEEYTCGGVISKRWFGYGYYETRAKLWGDRGFHSAFWTTGLNDSMPDTPTYKGPQNRVNEIDGFEIDSHAPDKLQYHSHWFVPEHVGNQGGVVTGPDSSADYHNYGFEWLPTEVRFYVDGVLTKTLPKAGPHGIQNIWLTTLGYTEGVVEDNLPGETTWDYFRYFAPIQTGADQSGKAVIVDNGDAGYTESGTWENDLNNDRQVVYGFQDKEVRWSTDLGGSASWKPRLRGTSSYEVFVWNPSMLKTGHSAARYTVKHDGGSTEVVVDQQAAGQQWVSLGNFTMTPGNEPTVTLAGDPSGSGTLRADAVKFQPAVIIDNGDPGYTETGAWAGSSSVVGWRGTGTRYASASASTARWTPTLTAGTYDVYAYVPQRDANTAESKFSVVHNGKTAIVPLDPDARTAQWVRLGNFDFAAGSGGSVTLTKDFGVAGLMRADAVKFVPAEPESGAPATPRGLKIKMTTVPSNGDAYFRASWRPVGGADVVGYHVYLDGQRLTWQPVQRTSFSLHELLTGQTYRIAVTAVDRLGNESAPTTAVPAVVSRDTQAPKPPTGLVAEAANGEAVLYWDQSTELDLGGYHVYVNGLRYTTEPYGNINDAHNRALGFLVEKLTNNVQYAIELTTVDLAGNESAGVATTVKPLPMSIIGTQDTDAGYSETGIWGPSSVPGWLGGKTRAANDRTATATWRPNLAAAGSYEVWAWVPNHSNASPSARYLITHSAGLAEAVLDQTTGGNQWIKLVTYDFAAGTVGSVTISNQAAAGYLRTDNVKFVPLG